MLTEEQRRAIDEAAAAAAEKVRAIEDPEERIKAATAAMAAAELRARNHREGTRDPALLSLHFIYKATPVQCYTPLGLSRNLVARMLREYRKHGSRKQLPTFSKGRAGALRSAVDAHRHVLRQDAIITAVRAVRDDTAEDMLHGRIRKPDGSPYSNADVARLTGLTTARVSQLRQGTR